MGVAIGLAGRRLLQVVPVMIGVSILAFSLVSFLPGGTALAILGDNATTQQIQALDQKLGLNQPPWERYGHWFWNAIQGNFGDSLLTQQSVMSTIAKRLPVTAEIVVVAVIIALAFAIPVAVLAARKPLGIADWIARFAATAALSVPGFILALVLLLVVSVDLRWLPPVGFTPLTQSVGGNLRSVILPSVSVGFLLFGTYSRVLRGDMLDQLGREHYVVTARSKGIGEWRILIAHVLKNSLFSIVTLVGTHFGVAIGGSVVIENIFGLPGMGQLLQQAILTRDVPVVLGVVVIVAFAVVAMNFLTDVSYLFLDPRVRYGTADR